MINQPCQLDGGLLGSNSLNPYHRHTSSNRGAMYSNHLGQMLVLNGSTERRIQTGYEREYAKYTFNVKMPCNGLIIDIIERYRKSLGKDSIEENPQTILVYEDMDTKQIGIVNLTAYCSNHQYFGFRYKTADGYKHIRIGAMIKEGTVFLDSPSVTTSGGYKYGIQANICYMTHPATSEDGILICRDFLPKLGFNTYETRVVEWGSKKFALNCYGDENNYKPFPDIGDRIRPDGVLMALRPYDPIELAVVEQSVQATMNVDYTFDTTVYVNGPGGRVVDIRIHHDLHNFNHAESHMDSQAQRYDTARRQFYKRIVDVWKRLYKMRGEALQITPEFSRLVVEAQSVVSEGIGQRVSKIYRQEPLDDYRVEFVVEYDIEPGIGFKLTDCFGGKGVICQIAEPHEMPVDEEGNRADIVMDPNSTISRLIPSRMYEQYVNASSRDTHKRLCAILGVAPETPEEYAMDVVSRKPQHELDAAWNYLMGFYKIVSPQMHSWFADGIVKADKDQYLSEIVEKGITLFIPPDNPRETEDIVLDLEQHYRPVYGPVTYVGNSGRRITTKKNIRIGSMYVILLEKIGDDWSAVSSGKLQVMGVLSQLTKTDKYSKPARNQAVRGDGEAEVRIGIAYVGSEYIAERMDRNNNPQTHKIMTKNLVAADKPTDIENLVDRLAHPFGGAKPPQLVRHLAEVSGFMFEYAPYHPYNSVTK
ncbi:MAG: hypothetical protein PHQ58_04325 [Rhodoferax sp.]|uniref:hypothetical protein n=1 Tax=Rhodoferax sp. TaxID=50421 RepID=UPI002604B779|nr:hypothetical protein [Rhodoferax sp.]MDD2879641.1 hypothetical protein [Rhodoferax sp.]